MLEMRERFWKTFKNRNGHNPNHRDLAGAVRSSVNLGKGEERFRLKTIIHERILYSGILFTGR